ncbi:MAG: uncharacterized protein A8A55_1873 [Amphiamblys sp. WSBS2006]|nr:MAG: uncharacterized protein A8A55_1873 [Amphiamblys sp. WSBS2006]
MDGVLDELERTFVVLAEIGYNIVGIIQRDAPPVETDAPSAGTDTPIDECKEALAKDFVDCSNSFEALLDRAEGLGQHGGGQQESTEKIKTLVQKIKKQKEMLCQRKDVIEEGIKRKEAASV